MSIFVAAAWRPEQRRESDAVESLGEKRVECLPEGEIPRSDGDASPDLHPPLDRQQRAHVSHHALEAAASVPVGTQPVMHLGGAVEAHRDREPELFEKPPVVSSHERAVGRDRESHRHATSLCQRRRAARHRWSVARLTSGSPPRKARLTRAPGSAPLTSRSTARSAVSPDMFLAAPPNSPCWA